MQRVGFDVIGGQARQHRLDIGIGKLILTSSSQLSIFDHIAMGRFVNIDSTSTTSYRIPSNSLSMDHGIHPEP